MWYTVKPGADVSKLERRPEMVAAAQACASEFDKVGVQMCITSGCDGVHPAGAAHGRIDPHYTGEAFDCRTFTVPKDRLSGLVEAIKTRLGPKFKAILESDHLHIQKTVFGVQG